MRAFNSSWDLVHVLISLGLGNGDGDALLLSLWQYSSYLAPLDLLLSPLFS
jgi:hypothetical protein